jgi:hypothetical protein
VQIGEKRTAYRLLMGKPERNRWIDNIELGLGEREDGMVWTGLVWLRIGTGGELL